MRLIGLTGGIATGKSTVAAMLAAHGAGVVDADMLAREVLVPGAPAYAEVVERFGAGILEPSGAVDRPALGAIVFADPGLRAELERITHPRINELMRVRILDALASPAPLVVADIPLLFERGRETSFEGTLLIYAAPQVQVQRLRVRDGLTEDEARQRISAQMPIDHKRDRATWVIDNEGDLRATTEQVERWWGSTVGG